MKIGFDLDGVFINTPPFVPGWMIEKFYRDKENENLHYRIPGIFEQKMRIFLHFPHFRPPIVSNINYVRNLALANKDKYYLISSRFRFLEKRTSDIIKRYKLDKIFNAMYFNYSNSQPHEFKSEIIKKLDLDMYIDDDLQLLEYLVDKNPKTKFFWLNKNLKKTLTNNLFAIKNLSEAFK